MQGPSEQEMGDEPKNRLDFLAMKFGGEVDTDELSIADLEDYIELLESSEPLNIVDTAFNRSPLPEKTDSSNKFYSSKELSDIRKAQEDYSISREELLQTARARLNKLVQEAEPSTS